MKLRVKKVDPTAPTPGYAHEGDAGLDLTSRNPTFQIDPHETVMVRTGIACQFDEGWYGEIVPRSGVSSKRGLANVNSPSIIDNGYRGEVLVPLHNYSERVQVVEHGERIVQMLLKRYEQAEVVVVDELDETERGDGGFGSSGTGLEA